MATANPNGPYTAKKITESGIITTAGVGGFLKQGILTVTTNASELILRDGGASGTVMVEIHKDGATAKATERTGDIGPLRFDTDIYATLAGTGAEATIIYNQDSE